MSESVTLKSYFYEVLIPSSQKNTSSPIEDILHHVSISFMKKLALYKCFNPRTHTGCDESLSFEPINFHVSIHAPTRGATRYLQLSYWHPRCFNPRTHAGCDEYARLIQYTAQSFNPRTHTGCDLSCSPSISKELFQSTHPHGVRRLTLAYYKPRPWIVSIHAPTRGATALIVNPWILDVVSIHAPTRGATQLSLGFDEQ